MYIVTVPHYQASQNGIWVTGGFTTVDVSSRCQLPYSNIIEDLYLSLGVFTVLPSAVEQCCCTKLFQEKNTEKNAIKKVKWTK